MLSEVPRATTMDVEATCLLLDCTQMNHRLAYLAAERIFHELEQLIPKARLSVARKHGAP